MSTNINANLLREFITSKIGSDNKLNRYEARDLDIEDSFDEIVDEDDVVDIDDIVDNKKLYELFATMYVEEEEQKAEAKDEEEEKEEQTRVPEGQGSANA